jgi:hypothetical protein
VDYSLQTDLNDFQAELDLYDQMDDLTQRKYRRKY